MPASCSKLAGAGRFQSFLFSFFLPSSLHREDSFRIIVACRGITTEIFVCTCARLVLCRLTYTTLPCIPPLLPLSVSSVVYHITVSYCLTPYFVARNTLSPHVVPIYSMLLPRAARASRASRALEGLSSSVSIDLCSSPSAFSGRFWPRKEGHRQLGKTIRRRIHRSRRLRRSLVHGRAFPTRPQFLSPSLPSLPHLDPVSQSHDECWLFAWCCFFSPLLQLDSLN